MAKSIEVLSFTALDDNKFEATGTCDEVAFLARTILWQGEPIFKVQETGEEGEVKHLNMKDSSFDRGSRIAIARKLKQVRLAGGLPAEDTSELSVKELRARCVALGIEGWRDRSVRKADLVALVEAAAA
tara:strand:- start:6491 stop:6877 length:387 start_codon:yes stop_codon:yes gene_type:complete